MYIPLELAKKHLNIESSYTEDDEYILAIIDAAERLGYMSMKTSTHLLRITGVVSQPPFSKQCC